MDEELQKKIRELEVKINRIEIFLSSFSPFIPNIPDPEDNEFYAEAVKLAREYEKVSASLLQRKLQIGFNRAARLLDKMSENKVIAEGSGSKPRKVLKQKGK